jgi:hypothetical protein
LSYDMQNGRKSDINTKVLKAFPRESFTSDESIVQEKFLDYFQKCLSDFL